VNTRIAVIALVCVVIAAAAAMLSRTSGDIRRSSGQPLNPNPRTISGFPRVVDGDTIIINSIHIRLQGLDAEELSMAHGQQSKAAMLDIVGNRTITCRPDGTHSYERIVASCFLPDGTDISRELVRRGLALDCAHYSGGRYRADEPAGIRQKLFQARYC
jgi:micrococcal nuclease